MIVLESRGTLRRFLLCRYGGAAWCVGQTEQAQAVVHCFGGSVGGSVESTDDTKGAHTTKLGDAARARP